MKIKNLSHYYWHIPALTFFLIFLLYPVVFGVIISFFKWDGLNPDIFKNFVGISNYFKLFKDEIFWISLRNTVYFTIGTVFIQIFLGFFLAVFIFLSRVKQGSLIRSIIFLPGILSGVLVALIWRQLLMDDGVINLMLNSIGIPTIHFLASTSLVIWTVTAVNIWQFTGFNLVILYAGLQSINLELLESSSLDGANFWQNIYYIIFPIIKPTIWLNVLFNFIGGFRVFDIIWNMTKGGPAHASEVLTTMVYLNSFGGVQSTNRMGYASAIAVVLMVIVLVFTILRIRYIRGGE